LEENAIAKDVWNGSYSRSQKEVCGTTSFSDGTTDTLAIPVNPSIAAILARSQMLEAVVATGKPVVLVLEGGGPLDIRWASEHVAAILEAWYPGTEGGDAVADVLFGDVKPGGKLPVSWPRTAGSEPLYYNHTCTHDLEDAPGWPDWELAH
jgi:glycosyl hydrolase family 3